jgi:hypothetical protein
VANYDQRQGIDAKFGQLTAGVTSLDTTLTSPDFTSLPSDLSATKYVPITLADDSARTYETAWITAHSAGSSAVTVIRGREGSTARAWPTGSVWRCAPTVRDTLAAYTRGTLPGDAHLGMRAILTDENRVVRRATSGWIADDPPFAHMGCTDGFQAVAADLGTGTYTAFSAAQELQGGITFVNASDALQVPIAGRYRITAKYYITGVSVNVQCIGEVQINDNTQPPAVASRSGAGVSFQKVTNGDYSAVGQITRRLAAGDLLRHWMGCNAASCNTYGTTGYNGSFLEVLYLGP